MSPDHTPPPPISPQSVSLLPASTAPQIMDVKDELSYIMDELEHLAQRTSIRADYIQITAVWNRAARLLAQISGQ